MNTPVTSWSTNPDLNGGYPGIPMYEGMPPALLNDGVRAVMAAVFDEDVILRGMLASGSALFGVDTGVVNALVITSNPAITAYAANQFFIIIPKLTVTGAATIAIDGLAPVALVRSDGGALQTRDVLAGKPTMIFGDGAKFYLINSTVANDTPRLVGLALDAPGGGKVVTASADSAVLTDTSLSAKYVSGLAGTPSLAAAGLDGLDTGAVAANTWYYLYAITDGVNQHWLFALQNLYSLATQPAGYVYGVRCGAVLTDGASNVVAFKRRDRWSQFLSPPINTTGGAVGNYATGAFAAIALAAYVPPTAKKVGVSLYGSGVNGVAPNNSYGAYTATNAPPALIFGAGPTALSAEFLIEGANIYWYTQGAASLRFLGWEE